MGLHAYRGVLVSVAKLELPAVAVWWGFDKDDSEIVFKTAAENTVCLAQKNCPEVLKKPNGANKLTSITIQIFEADKQLLDFMGVSAATGSRHNGAAAVIGRFILPQFIKKVRIHAAKKEESEK